jgi:putative DNA primase/helicase
MKWTGCRWQHEPTQEVFDLARKVCADAGKGLADPKLRARILSASTRAAVENLARSDRSHAAVPEQWDFDLFALNEPRRAP